MAPFRVRLNCVDHYQAIPSHFDPNLQHGRSASQRKEAPRVPVIRVFGATEAGQKVCAHIHGALPYLYIEYDGSLIPEDVEDYIHRLHLSIDHTLAVSYRRNIYDGKTNFVAHITLVKGTPFYGFHVGYRFFLKVYILNPIHMTRLADVLRQGSVLRQVFQPYESHMQYLLQWMCDYNLYGCGYIDCDRVKFRGPVPEYMEMASDAHEWHDLSIPQQSISDENVFPKQSHCSIEVDVKVEDILNRLKIKSRPIHHDFVERENPIPPDEKLVFSMAGLWRDETRRRNARMGNPDADSSSFPPEVMVSMSAESRNSERGGWIHEEEYMEKIRQIIADEKAKSDGGDIEFNSFVSRTAFETTVQTTFESVEDLFSQNLPPVSASSSTSNPLAGHMTIEVDEASIPKFEDEEDYNISEGLPQQDDPSSGASRAEKSIPSQVFMNDIHSIQDSKLDDPERAISPSDLEALGVRKHGDLSHASEDAFEIPSRFTSKFKASRPLEETTGRSRLPNKKRRLDSNGHKDIRAFERVLKNTSKDIFKARSNDYDHMEAPSSFQPIRLGFDSQESSQKLSASQGPMKNLSQEMIKSTGANKSLSFSLVKNPQDPTTLRRLSQHSASQKGSSPIKSKQDSTESFDTVKKMALFSSNDLKSPISDASTNSLRLQNLADNLGNGLDTGSGGKVLIFADPAPAWSFVASTMLEHDRPPMIYQDAYYSNEKDVPERAREYAGREFKIEGNTVPFLPKFDPTGESEASKGCKAQALVDKAKEASWHKRRSYACNLRNWEIAEHPPTFAEVSTWAELEDQLDTQKRSLPTEIKGVSQIEGATQKDRHGFKFSQKKESTSVKHEAQYMSVMSLEIHVNTRKHLLPNPEEDQIECIFWCIQSDESEFEDNGSKEGIHVGVLVLSEDQRLERNISRQTAVEVESRPSEIDLIDRMVEIVRMHDPDILTGYEVHGGSWGYMIERARHKYDYDLCDEFSRMKSQSHGRIGKENDRWGFNNTSTIRVTGRHMINIWRAMRGELNLLQYTMENVAFHLLHKRIPHYHWQDLTKWYRSSHPRDLAKVVDYYINRVQIDLEILEQNEIIPRTSEQARLLGVDFFSVFSRGSQFKVESLMFRIAKPENLLLISPNRKQVGGQNALECLPLVMEPQSDFYNSPLLVLDFQSLYPSVMIAYNYCYSTFLGRIVNWKGQNKMGFTDYKRQERLLELLRDDINIAPNGMIFAKPEIRKSLLAKMLGEILETRVMVKSGMKIDKDDKTLQRLLNNRQLALKLIANVTYGYTSASFSGRMPCSEIADSIVQTARETLEKAIALIHSVEKWGAEVVYGDTDSLFVYLKGRTKDEAFEIGRDIADTITKMNPRPVKLKFEKVYFPCVLLAKKRYVGFKYEDKHQKEPEFDAKGIETVRRDGTPAEQKIEEKALKILFKTADLSQVKTYFQQQCSKIMKGKVSIQDFCFAKEVRLGSYSEKGLPPPGALISTRKMLADPRAEPQYGERVPYVVITGAPGARLIDRCVAPEVFLQDDHNELDAEYYISKNLIPPLERIFNLVGANVRAWYDEMPKTQRIRNVNTSSLRRKPHEKPMIVTKKTLESYLKSSLCIVCRSKLESNIPICSECLSKPAISLLALRTRQATAEKKALQLQAVCHSCSGFAWADEVKCDSKDCNVFYSRTRHTAALKTQKDVEGSVIDFLEAGGKQALEW